MKRICTVLLTSVLVLDILGAQTVLPRRPYWGVSFTEKGDGLVVNRVDRGFSFDKAGVIINDLILSIDGVKMQNRSDGLDVLQKELTGSIIEIQILRGQDTSIIQVEADPFPYEQVDGVRFEYASFITDQGDHLRTVISRPDQVKSKLPAIIFIQWLSCDAIDAHPLYDDGNIRLIHDLSKAGYLVMRTEKPGVGDSRRRITK